MGELNFHQEHKQKKKEDKQPRTEIHPNGYYALNDRNPLKWILCPQ